MRAAFLAALLGLALPASAATLQVDETATRLVWHEGSTGLELAVLNSGEASVTARVDVDVLHPLGSACAGAAADAVIPPGASTLSLPIVPPLSELSAEEQTEVLLYRLRYRLAPAAGAAPVEGIVSISRIASDLFELRVSAPPSSGIGTPYPVTVLAVQAGGSVPVEGVAVEATLGFEGDDAPLHATGRTGSDGFARLQIPVPARPSSREATLRVRGLRAGLAVETTDDVRIGENLRVVVTTDKGLYQPGQTLHTRVLALVPGGVLDGGAGDVRIRDDDGSTVFQSPIQTSRLGVASVDWAIPESVRLGNYGIEVRFDGITDAEVAGWRQVRVSRYELPQFTVNAKPDRAVYLPGEDAVLEVRAEYLYGERLEKGQVRVVREAERSWNNETGQWDSEEGESYVGALDRGGRFLTRVALSRYHADLSDGDERYRDLTFTAYVTDASTGRTERRRFPIRLSREPIHVFLIEASDGLARGEPLDAYVSTFSADGTPVSCLVAVSFQHPDRDGRSWRPRWQPAPTVQEVRTNRFGLARLSGLVPRQSDDDEPVLGLEARDAQGRTGHEAVGIRTRDEDWVHLDPLHTLHRPGEPVEVEVLASTAVSAVLLDLARDGVVLRSAVVPLREGKGRVRFDYDKAFRGHLSLVAYTAEEGSRYSGSFAWRPVVYPLDDELRVGVRFGRSTYKPGEDARADLSLRTADGSAAEGVLGVVVLDKALEERMRTDAESWGGASLDSTDPWSAGEAWGGVTARDLLRLKPARRAPEDLDLVAAVLFRWSDYYPRVVETRQYRTRDRAAFAPGMAEQLQPVARGWRTRYKDDAFPENLEELRATLARAAIDFDALRDPWGTPYSLSFLPERDTWVATVTSAGPDEQPGTTDDLMALRVSWEYFKAVGRALDRAAGDYHDRTGGYVRDSATLREVLSKEGIDLDAQRDPWGHAYRVDFGVERERYVIRVRSAGPGGVFRDDQPWADVPVWRNAVDAFAETRVRIGAALDAFLAHKGSWPADDAQLDAALRAAGLDGAEIRDLWGTSLDAEFNTSDEYGDRIEVYTYASYPQEPRRHTTITPVTRHMGLVRLRSRGPDRRPHTGDDFEMASFWRALSEQGPADQAPSTPAVAGTGMPGMGGIHGTVRDAQGNVVPGATVSVTRSGVSIRRDTTSDANGRYALDGLEAGDYQVLVELAGFRRVSITRVPVAAPGVTRLDVVLDVAALAETVTVSAEAPEISTTSSAVSGVVERRGGQAASRPIVTPRLRQFFPETLVWAPSVETDARGNAELRFHLADTITTWTLRALASNAEGKIGLAEGEVTAFQPFFIDHDPPPVLTQGDRIALPVVLHNYLPEPLSVEVGIRSEPWLAVSGARQRSTTISAGGVARETFEVRATAPTRDGRSRVTALSSAASDAVEKPSRVHPDGEEVVRTLSLMLADAGSLDVEFPPEALTGSAAAEVRIYPSLLAHVFESVESVLERPHGCAEQTLSASYPSLLLLRYEKAGGRVPQAVTERARRYLALGYERLLGFRASGGGFSYWGHGDDADVALTAYALRFLDDARGFVAVDDEVPDRALYWLLTQQRGDGGWGVRDDHGVGDDRGSAALTALVARAVAGKADRLPAERALGFLSRRIEELDEPYAIATYALAAARAGDGEAAGRARARLRPLARDEAGGAYWSLETNTPFHGWGSAGRLETTALAVLALAAAGGDDVAAATLRDRGVLFLLKQKDRYGAWQSTQATLSAVEALLAVLSRRNDPPAASSFEVLVDGKPVQAFPVSGDGLPSEPLRLDVSGRVAAGRHRIELRGAGEQAMMQAVLTHYRPWPAPLAPAGPLRLSVAFDRTTPGIGTPVACSVSAERVGFRGYGMLLAEIGLPPGAEVDRSSLDRALREGDGAFYRYEIQPDRVVAYLWPQAGVAHLAFTFRPRFAEQARTGLSRLYDYYNPEAAVVVQPADFIVR